jgi:hypothetical protein
MAGEMTLRELALLAQAAFHAEMQRAWDTGNNPPMLALHEVEVRAVVLRIAEWLDNHCETGSGEINHATARLRALADPAGRGE